jgi:hypothetical protein
MTWSHFLAKNSPAFDIHWLGEYSIKLTEWIRYVVEENPKSYVVFGCVMSSSFLRSSMPWDEAISHDSEIARYPKDIRQSERCSK